ncbi:MAG: hypothetical protein AAF735_03510 [Myxococcota bacterium]
MSDETASALNELAHDVGRTKSGASLAGDLAVAVDDATRVVILVGGELDDATQAWALVSMSPARHRAYLQDSSDRNVAPEDYGNVLAYGEGEAPSAVEREAIRCEYGIELEVC